MIEKHKCCPRLLVIITRLNSRSIYTKSSWKTLKNWWPPYGILLKMRCLFRPPLPSRVLVWPFLRTTTNGIVPKIIKVLFDCILVHFGGSGNTMKVLQKHLRQIEENFSRLPFYAVKIKLAEVEPLDDTISWPQSVKKFKKYVVNSKCVFRIDLVLKENDGTSIAHLTDTHGLEVGQHMLNLRAAKPIGLCISVKEVYRRAHPALSLDIPDPSSDTQSIINHLRRGDFVTLAVSKAWERLCWFPHLFWKRSTPRLWRICRRSWILTEIHRTRRIPSVRPLAPVRPIVP